MVGGELVTALAEATGAAIIPVDSEHSALHQLIHSERTPGSVDRLVLTASGGPFREREDLADVTVAEALAHPTWDMGGRITIDSATLFNKGLELIEAHHLFGFAYEAIDVVVHPQSIVHSLIHLNDGASLAHLGYPDMRVPISYALHHPDRADVPVPALDLAAVGELTFEAPDLDRFPCLRLAREAGQAGGTAPCVLNAADEVAVAAFLDERIPFTAIPRVVEQTLAEMPAVEPTHFQDLYAVDAEARERAEQPHRGGRGVSWVLAFAGFAMLVILHEAGPLRGRQGGGDEGREVLPLLPAEAGLGQARRDRVRDRRDTARGLREDHRDEPGRGDPGRGRAPRVLLAARLEADRGDRRRPVRERRDRVRDPVLPRELARPAIALGRVRRARDAGRLGPGAGRRAGRGRWRPRRLPRPPGPDRHARVRGRAGGRLRRRDGRDAHDPPRRPRDHADDPARVRRRARPAAPGLRARRRAAQPDRRPRRRSARSTSCGRSRPAPSG